MTTLTAIHTPIPWAVNGLGFIYSSVEAKTVIAEEPSETYKFSQKYWESNAAHIVKCVNERESLIEALSLMVRTVGDCMRHGYTDSEVEALTECCDKARVVLARTV